MNPWDVEAGLQIRYQIGRLQRTKCQGSRKVGFDAIAPTEKQRNYSEDNCSRSFII